MRNVLREPMRLIAQARELVFAGPLDSTSQEGRSRERNRRILLSAFAAIGGRGISLLVTLVTVPVTLHYLGAERYGLWMTISSTVAMLGFADLGVSNSLVNLLSDANGRGDKEMAREHVSTAFFVLLSVACLLGLLFFIVYPLVSWGSFYNVSSSQALREAGPAMAVFVVWFLIGIPLTGIQQIQTGYQEGYINSGWQVGGSIASLIGIVVAVKAGLSLPWLVVALVGFPALGLAANGLVLFVRRRPWLIPRVNSVTRHSARKVLRLGLLFLALQVTAAISYASENLIIARLLGPEAVAQYAVPFKLFSVVSMFASLVVSPLWPAYGESIARADYGWARKTLIRSILLSLILASIPAIVLVAFGSSIIRLWVGDAIKPPMILLIGLSVWTIVGTVGNSVAMFLNGASIVGFQVIVALVFAVVSIILKIVLVGSLGSAGAPLATSISYLLLVAIPYALFIPRWIRVHNC